MTEFKVYTTPTEVELIDGDWTPTVFDYVVEIMKPYDAEAKESSDMYVFSSLQSANEFIYNVLIHDLSE